MADEITIIPYIKVTKSGATYERATASISVTMTGDAWQTGVQEIGTSAENIVKGDVSTVGWCYFKNLDSTNYIEIGFDDTGFVTFLKLKPGEAAICRLSQDVPQAKADTGACDLEYAIIED